eukprot:1158955-Pelagomonas_calceolata.AAC.25
MHGKVVETLTTLMASLDSLKRCSHRDRSLGANRDMLGTATKPVRTNWMCMMQTVGFVNHSQDSVQ